MRVPLKIDLALHASPSIALVTEFIAFQKPYSSYETTFIAPILAAFAGVGYGSWTEYCGFHNGECASIFGFNDALIKEPFFLVPYPFLTDNPFKIRVGIYGAATLLSISLFRALNRLHPDRRTAVIH